MSVSREKAVKGVMRRVADETLEGWDTMGGDADGASEPSFLRDAEEQLQALDVDGMSSVSVVSSMAHLPVNEENAELRERNLQLRARLADEIRAREREIARSKACMTIICRPSKTC